MKVSVVGTGYVGLVSGTCFAEMGHSVTCIDIDSKKIETLKQGKSPIYEPGLTELLVRNIQRGNLYFSDNFSSVSESQVVFLAVGTPSNEVGKANLEYLYSAASSLIPELQDQTLIVIKSTVPVGTALELKKFLLARTDKKFFLVNNPEFLKEGSAVDDFMRPDRVVIGHDNEFAAHIMEELYAPLVRQGNPILKMSNISAEMTKYAANCLLATKISFINEMSRLCDSINADIDDVRKGITSDKRIGPHFLYPGPGYGGSCFPKDVKALIHSAKDLKMNLKIMEAVEEVNIEQKVRLYCKIREFYKNDLQGRVFAIWGVSFKPNTDDIRESSAIDMAREIISAGASVQFYDPVAGENFEKHMFNGGMGKVLKERPDALKRFYNKYDCLKQADALVILTDWAEFKAPELMTIKECLKRPTIFDGRNLLNINEVLEHGFSYHAFGRFIPSPKKVSSLSNQAVT